MTVVLETLGSDALELADMAEGSDVCSPRTVVSLRVETCVIVLRVGRSAEEVGTEEADVPVVMI